MINIIFDPGVVEPRDVERFEDAFCASDSFAFQRLIFEFFDNLVFYSAASFFFFSGGGVDVVFEIG